MEPDHRAASANYHRTCNKPIYARTAAYGHFGRKAGRDGSFSWEKLDLVKPLKEAIKG